jgi:hypothetical protein
VILKVFFVLFLLFLLMGKTLFSAAVNMAAIWVQQSIPYTALLHRLVHMSTVQGSIYTAFPQCKLNVGLYILHVKEM